MTAITAMTGAELRQTAVLADACLRIEAARLYGFLEGGPPVNQDRCEEVIAYARERGLEWTEQEVTDTGIEFVRQANAETRASDKEVGG